MAEDYGIVRYKSFTSSDAFDALLKLEQCIAHAGASGYWEKDNSIPQASGELLLRPIPQTFSPAPALGNPNDCRIAVQALAGGFLKFGYFPVGWDPAATTFNDVITSSTVSWSGMRSITGTTSGFGAVPDQIHVAQYRDELTGSSPYPGCSLTVLLIGNASSEIKYGAHIGRIVACDDATDFGLGIFGDAILTGAPFASATTASWLKGAFAAAQTADSSIFWGGGNEWYFAQVGYDPTAQMLDGVNDIRRFFPYSLVGVGRARGGTANSSTYCGILGQTKYIRELDATYSFKARLKSRTPGSNQIWRASVFDTNNQSQVILWGPEVEVP